MFYKGDSIEVLPQSVKDRLDFYLVETETDYQGRVFPRKQFNVEESPPGISFVAPVDDIARFVDEFDPFCIGVFFENGGDSYIRVYNLKHYPSMVDPSSREHFVHFPWKSNKRYNSGDLVSVFESAQYNLYLCIKDHISNDLLDTSESDYWQLFVEDFDIDSVITAPYDEEIEGVTMSVSPDEVPEDGDFDQQFTLDLSSVPGDVEFDNLETGDIDLGGDFEGLSVDVVDEVSAIQATVDISGDLIHDAGEGTITVEAGGLNIAGPLTATVTVNEATMTVSPDEVEEDGELEQEFELTLTNAEFDGDFDDDTHVTLGGDLSGLSVAVVRDSDTQATLTLTGDLSYSSGEGTIEIGADELSISSSLTVSVVVNEEGSEEYPSYEGDIHLTGEQSIESDGDPVTETYTIALDDTTEGVPIEFTVTASIFGALDDIETGDPADTLQKLDEEGIILYTGGEGQVTFDLTFSAEADVDSASIAIMLVGDPYTVDSLILSIDTTSGS